MTLRRCVVLLLALGLVTSIPLVTAGDDSDDKDDDRKGERSKAADVERVDDDEDRKDDDDDKDEREVKTLMEEGRAVLKYERKSNASEGELEFEVIPREGVIRLKFEEESAGTEDEYELDVRVREVFEYRDANANGAFDPDADDVVSAYRTDALDWSFTSVEDVTFGGAPAKSFAASAGLGDTGKLMLRFIASGAFATQDGVALTPTDLKFDIGIDDYPFEANDTLLGVHTKVEQKSESKSEPVEDVDAGDSVVVVSGGNELYFAWADNVTVDGVSHPVTSTVTRSVEKTETKSEDGETESEHESERTVYLSYPRGSAVLHDPVVGVQSADVQEKATSPIPTLGAGLMLAAVMTAGLVATLRRRCG